MSTNAYRQLPSGARAENEELNYKVYSALLTQTTTNAPVATVLENTLNGTPVWTRTDTGTYECTLASAWTANKTWSVPMRTGDALGLGIDRVSANVLELRTYNATQGSGDLSDSQLNGSSIEIRVYF